MDLINPLLHRARMLKERLFSGPCKGIMYVSLTVSFLIHVVLFVSLQKAFPLSWITENMRTFQVELIRPPVDDLEKDFGAGAEIGSQQEKKPSSEEDQETISLDTDDRRYVSYAKAIKERIAKQWTYPPDAKAHLLEGKLRLLFSLTRSGELSRVQILQPSGLTILDQEATRAVRAGAPYPPFPEHVTVGRLNIDANFEYRLTGKK